ncbi:MAG: drug/metabolite transporter (DMT)-like permease, partial [Planctomycetaceae bacterium]
NKRIDEASRVTRTTQSYLYAGITVAFWSTVATAFKLSLGYLDIFQLVLYASVSAATVLVIPVIVSGNVGLMIDELRKYPMQTFGFALLNPLIYYLVLFAAYDRLPAQIAQPVNYTWALVLVLLSIIFLGQKPTRYDLIATAVSYGGVVIIALGSGSDNVSFSLIGLGLAILSTLIWASYWILLMKDPRDERVSMCLNFVTVLPMALVLCLIFSDLSVPWQGWLGASYVGIFEMGLAFLFWSKALRLAENTSRVSTLIFLSPFISLWLIHLVLGETIYPTTYVGLAVIVTGLLIQRAPDLVLQSAKSNRRNVDPTQIGPQGPEP